MASGDTPGAPGDPSDPLLELVRDKARQRQLEGLLPTDLEGRLDAHARLVGSRPEGPGARIRRAAEDLGPPTPDSVAADRSLRNVARRVLGRELTALAARVDDLAASVRAALLAAADAVDRPAQHTHPELSGSLDQALDKLATLQRALNAHAQTALELRQRIEVLETPRKRRPGGAGKGSGSP